MGAKSSFLASAIYKAILRNTGYTGPATVYLSLHTGAPGLNGANEVTGNNYARVAVSFGADSAGAGSSSAIATFPQPTPSAWGTLTYFGLWDAVSGGNFLGGAALTNQVVTSIGVAVDFPVGSITWTET